MIEKKKNDIFFILHILLLLVIIFLAVDLGSIDSYIIYYPTTSAVIKYIIILFIVLGLLLYIRKIHITAHLLILFICFVFRIILEIPKIGNGESTDSEIKYLLTLIVSLFVLMIYSQNEIEEKKNVISKSLIVSFIVIAIQTIITFVLTFQSMSAYWGLKDRLHLPIGSSNFVECWILMLTSFLFYRDKNRNIWKIMLFLVGFVSALCTRSKVALFFWGAWFVFIFLKTYLKPKLKNLLLIFAVLTAMYYVYQLFEAINFFEYSTKILLDLFSFDSSKRQIAFNGRIELYREAYNSFMYSTRTFLFGNGRSYSSASGIAHNYVLDVLATSGIIGLFFVIIQYVTVVSTLIHNRKVCGYSKAALIMICFIGINSMYEPCLDEYCFNIIYWMIISLGLNYSDNKEVKRG